MQRPQPQMPTASWGCMPAATPKREGESPSSRPAETSRIRLISELEIPTRAIQALARHGIRTIGVLITWSRTELANEVVGLGEKSLDALQEVLKAHGLAFPNIETTHTQQVQTPLTNSRHINNHSVWIASPEVSSAVRCPVVGSGSGTTRCLQAVAYHPLRIPSAYTAPGRGSANKLPISNHKECSLPGLTLVSRRADRSNLRICWWADALCQSCGGTHLGVPET